MDAKYIIDFCGNSLYARKYLEFLLLSVTKQYLGIDN
jgi:hypothetical protein